MAVKSDVEINNYYDKLKESLTYTKRNDTNYFSFFKMMTLLSLILSSNTHRTLCDKHNEKHIVEYQTVVP